MGIMSAPDICGFVVVRLPEYDVEPSHLRPPPVEGKVYRGLDRACWEVPDGIDETKRSAMEALTRPVRRWPFDSVFSPGITPHFRIAQEFMRLDEGVNETLAVHSDRLAEVCGSFEWDRGLEFLGYELRAAREWSPHWEGVFWHPEAFPDVLPLLNRHGLFDTENGIGLLAERYVALMREGIVEPLADPPDFVTVRLYRLLGAKP
jgi:hypothetical protein